MMGEYVKRSDALQAVGDVHPLDYNGQGIVERIKAIPAADVVEVVRCADCVHYNDKMEMYCDAVCTIRHYCDSSPIIVGKDDFCSSGKRKDGGQDE